MYSCDFCLFRGKKPATPTISTTLSHKGHDVGTPARTSVGVRRGKTWEAVAQLPEELFCYHSPWQHCLPGAWYCARHVCPWHRHGGQAWDRARLAHSPWDTMLLLLFFNKEKLNPKHCCVSICVIVWWRSSVVLVKAGSMGRPWAPTDTDAVTFTLPCVKHWESVYSWFQTRPSFYFILLYYHYYYYFY